MSDLSALRKLAAETLALAERATPAEWEATWGLWGEFCYIARKDTAKKLATVYGTDKQKAHDGAFIAHARTAAPSLAKAVEAMAAVVEAARDYEDAPCDHTRQALTDAVRTLTEVLKS